MELQIPGLPEMKNDLAEIKETLRVLKLERDDRFIAKTIFIKEYDVSNSACVNYEREGLLIAYRLKGRVYYRQSDITQTLEQSIIK